MKPATTRTIVLAILFLFTAGTGWAQSGKIAGVVTEAATGTPLPGVNVVVMSEGETTTIGTQTDVDGYYTILNVPPGTYELRASFLGFANQIQSGVRVNINLTTEANFELQEEAVGLAEIVVEATEPVVRPDVSASVSNLNSEDLENIPVSSVQEAIGLQAGVEPGMSFRGSGMDEVSFMVDGMSMRDARNNSPFTSISYTAIEEVQVQTGGFNAEYGNVRSGLVNVVTKEGRPDRYTADVLLRYEPAAERYFGAAPNNPDAYWMRPYVDPEVAYTGTEDGAWDLYTQNQYPRFEGWNTVSNGLMNDDDPSNDLTPEQLREVFLFRHRKSMEIEDPNHTIDATAGGPVPLISQSLGRLRFMASYRQSQSSYVIPQRRDAFQGRTGQVKLTSDIARGMKLTLQGMYAEESGLNAGYAGGPAMYRDENPAYPWSNSGLVSDINRDMIFALDALALQDINRTMLGATLTHTLSATTFYEARLQRSSSDYLTGPGPLRSDEVLTTIGGVQLDEAPFGWQPSPSNDYSGLRLGGQWGHNRDSSNVSSWTGEFGITSQINRYAQVKAGAEMIFSDYHTNYGIYDEFFAADNRPKFKWDRSPKQGAVYGQTKLEFRGMIANLGLRLDVFDPSGDWYDFDTYERTFSSLYGVDALDTLMAVPTEVQMALSPRLGVSFPVTETSKFYVNYGHFRQMLDPNDLYLLREITYTGAIDQVGNPNHPMPRTVAYELGYSQSILDRLLVNVTGYYKALDRQPRQVRHVSLDGEVNFTTSVPANYADIRGFEVTLSKNSGQWVRGFANFTYMAVKRGNFGFDAQYENQLQQQQLERESRAHYQERPVPEPYARVNLEFIAPKGFGPEVAGVNPLGDWRLDLLGQWRAGQAFTWAGAEGQSIAGLENNVRWTDYYGLDLRLSKAFNTTVGQAQFFVDMSNVFNLKYLHNSIGFEGSKDFERYMQSLHLSEDIFDEIGGESPYSYIPGDDLPGDYRRPGAEFVPIEIVGAVADVSSPQERPLYYEQDSGEYMWWRNGAWEAADRGVVNDVLDDKAYIDMPNETYFSFLNPRRVTFGLRISL